MTNDSRPDADIGKATQANLGEVPLNGEGMATVLTIHRAAAAIRNHIENSALRSNDLSWTSFVVLWIVWTGGTIETGHAAEKAGISKGTLTGVAKTLESRDLMERRAHHGDARRVVLKLTATGAALMDELFLSVHAELVFVSEPFTAAEAESLTLMLQRMETHVGIKGPRRQQDARRNQQMPPRRSGRRANTATTASSED
ncbi:MarR family winged helix-turn-helix transcriptional regulator [Nocardia sp. NRRL S-836]|uniref:MarR family winged helix-turn-helix transcriptional regulator n=1 Tax=Nocardia sp. NRRL S-836 TaxID=1519492 RepID=UPI0006AF815D|nr:MarR family transcriptional regulator [Nocardia sp. NRRL S-836]KOV84688.1 hypothetical protein ADL03_15555 [Nocardia sp. NRRL S-836]